MARLTLVRHGRAAAGWGADLDPGLDDLGRAQAEAMADVLAPSGPLPIVVSPLRRTRDTAAPLEQRWAVEGVVDPSVGEIESPSPDLAQRELWLRELMQGTWSAAPALDWWRGRVIDSLAAITTDTVVVSHFVAINVAVAHATGDDRVVCFVPDNCSRTVIDTDGDRFTVVELGEQVTSTRVQ
ncbi:MAG TPA: histidine phosphatase family protein [Mycobacteriales bacterium]|nr:histidine phosphatase family protein [Mycobacteriales bacterium]